MLFCSGDGIADVPQITDALVVNHFEVADGGEATRTPVDHVASAINQTVAVEAQESFEHRAIERRLQSETLARPIAGCAEANHLFLDHAAAFRFPFPDAALEFFGPRSWRLMPSLASMRSTTNCVAIPAWSMPGSHSVRSPRMRCQRTSVSICVCSSMWPMCIEPVTLGGGRAMEKVRPLPSPEFSARNNFSSNQVLAQRCSISCGS